MATLSAVLLAFVVLLAFDVALNELATAVAVALAEPATALAVALAAMLIPGRPIIAMPKPKRKIMRRTDTSFPPALLASIFTSVAT